MHGPSRRSNDPMRNSFSLRPGVCACVGVETVKRQTISTLVKRYLRRIFSASVFYCASSITIRSRRSILSVRTDSVIQPARHRTNLLTTTRIKPRFTVSASYPLRRSFRPHRGSPRLRHFRITVKTTPDAFSNTCTSANRGPTR